MASPRAQQTRKALTAKFLQLLPHVALGAVDILMRAELTREIFLVRTATDGHDTIPHLVCILQC